MLRRSHRGLGFASFGLRLGGSAEGLKCFFGWLFFELDVLTQDTRRDVRFHQLSGKWTLSLRAPPPSPFPDGDTERAGQGHTTG